MGLLRRIGIDTYMVLLFLTVGLGVLLPADGMAADALKHVTYWAVSLLFFLYGAKLDPGAVRAGITNIPIQGLTFVSTYVMFPIFGFIFAWIFGPLLGEKLTFGLMFLAVLPSTVQSSIAFTSIARGNVAAAICAASVSNLVGVALTPAMVAFLLHQGDGGVSLDSVIKIGTQILLPFIVGQVLRPWVGGFVQKHKFLTMIVDRGSILLIIYAAFSRSTVTGLWNAIPASSLLMLIFVMLIFLAVTMSVITGMGRLFKLNYPDRASLFYCGSTKSLASGMPIATALFAANELGAIVLPLLVYHMSQLLVCAYISQKAGQRTMEPAEA